MTYGQVLDKITGCTTEAEATAVFDEIVADASQNSPELSPEQIAENTRANIGYLSGYCDRATADRILELFHTAHPIFGSGHPTSEEAFAAGVAAVKKAEVLA